MRNKKERIKTMRNLRGKLKNGGVIAFVAIIILAAAYGISWIVCCGIIKIIFFCFGFTYPCKKATGIWLILCVVQSIRSATKK
jgi:hypothetical protein